MESSRSSGEPTTTFLARRRENLGLPFLLLLLYAVLDFGRPADPMGIPMVISILLLVAWILAPAKRFNLHVACYLALLGAMSIGVLIAVNEYSAYQTLVTMAIMLLCICIPLMHYVDSLRKIRIFVNVLVVVFFYIGIWAVLHDGYGPAGARGAQDENYTSAMMCIAIPLAYFSIPVTNRRVIKVFYAAALCVFVMAVVVSGSRGGFIGLIGVVLYCIVNSPRKKQALSALVVAALVVSVAAGPRYWEEMATITDPTESTADSRLELWTLALRMFAHNPVIGVGPGNFRWNTGLYQSAEQWEKFRRDLTYSWLVHSTYFEILAEMGLAGTLLFATILFRSWTDLKRIRSRERLRDSVGNGVRAVPAPENESTVPEQSRQLHYCSLALSGSLVGFLLPAAFISFTYFLHFWLLVSLAAALSAVARQTTAKLTDSSSAVGGVTSRRL